MKVRTLQQKWARYWIVWLLGGFLIPELWALIGTRRGDTLSESIWTMTSRWPWTKLPLGGLLAWLLHHLLIDRRSKLWV